LGKINICDITFQLHLHSVTRSFTQTLKLYNLSLASDVIVSDNNLQIFAHFMSLIVANNIVNQIWRRWTFSNDTSLRNNQLDSCTLTTAHSFTL